MPDHEPEATPEQQAQVRRLLGEARHGGPIPPDVARRLDGVLEQLVSEGPRAIDPPPPPRSAAVIDLGARRRRRVTGLLAAAAAVVVVGVGIGQVLDTTSSDGGGDESGANADAEGLQRGTEDPDGGSAAEKPPESAPSIAPSDEAPAEDLPSISEGSFARDVRERQDDPGVVVSAGDMIDGSQLSLAESFMCPPTMWGPGKVVAVLYESQPSVLVYRTPVGDTQTVELRQCGSGDVLRSTVLPAP